MYKKNRYIYTEKLRMTGRFKRRRCFKTILIGRTSIVYNTSYYRILLFHFYYILFSHDRIHPNVYCNEIINTLICLSILILIRIHVAQSRWKYFIPKLITFITTYNTSFINSSQRNFRLNKRNVRAKEGSALITVLDKIPRLRQ